MRALVFDPQVPGGIRFGQVPEPDLADDQALVQVAAASLNFGEVSPLTRAHQPGDVLGWDAAGVVVRPARDGSGPPAGTRVVTFAFAGGAWAQLRAVATGDLAALPEGVDVAAASALPAAGVSALRAVRRLASILGRRVLVTGASGGVGRFAVQLAALSGAHVVASVGSEARGEGLLELGAAEVVVGLDQVAEPVAGAIDSVGGPQLARLFDLLAADGSIQQVGIASGQATTFDHQVLERGHWLGGKRLESFGVGPVFGPDLGTLVGLMAAGRLDAHIGWRGPWERAADAIDALLARRVLGKAVLEIAA
jgi:NADPH:quinone reductase